ncbi:NADH-quinone oxidoreductase subunit N [Friedmanniella endophytica]|uniref:NADH-quinone oxidoreductase subunit N n=1 Tax=Microlunatus kandeliicorticis TaxID=1759536 RepID=A0A7W3P4E6_9ACTN|nr:NADH-quinone oxidoreductase subunit NuoN [Microlunatus kandeliicorticis]MBA8792792.1 NADH-quinone oxidoreductase subunit N [Microlunatus kandeliicorticis]
MSVLSSSVAAVTMEITAPKIEYGTLMPFILVFLVACLGVLVEALAPRTLRFGLQMLLTFGGIVVALLITVLNWLTGARGEVAVGAVTADVPTYFFWVVLLVFSGLSFLIFADRKLENGALAFTPQGAATPGSAAEQEAITARVEHTEVFPLAMFALSGMMLFPASNDLLTMFVALEILSLPLYLLCGLGRRRRLLSQESSLKYFLLGALSSAFFLYGVALVYGYAGSFQLSDIAVALNTSDQKDGLLLAGMALIGVGLLFKFGAVPFHSWTPDVYAGAPTGVTAFMAACTKIAAVGALLRVFYVAFGGMRWDWQPLLLIVTVATMFVGAVLGITQTDVKRMLAYSSIAHAGFILTAVTAASQLGTGKPAGSLSSISAVGFYLVAYGAATLGAFGIVTMVRDRGGEATLLSSWAGLGRRSPLTATVFSLFLLSFAGIPLTSGFIGKWSVFAAAWAARDYWLVVVAVVLSLVAAFFYLRVIIVMFFSEPELEATGAQPGTVVRPGWTTLTAVGVGVVATVALGVFPGPVLALAQQAGEFLR